MRGIYSVAAGTGFADAIAATVLDRHGQAPEALGEVTILVPTRRAVRALEEGFQRQAGGRALLLPAIRPIGDADEDELTVALAGENAAGAELPPAIAPLRRQLLLTRDIRERDKRLGDAEAVRLAAALAAFIDEADTAEADMARLATLVEGELTAHWQRTLDLLAALAAAWRQRLASEGRSDPAWRRSRLLDRLDRLWRRQPPQGPVIAAGTTGTIPATARLLATILGLPQGQVVLPGLDLEMSDAAWEAIGPSHPQHALKSLLERLQLARGDVTPWPLPPAARLPRGRRARRRLLSQALLPPQAEADEAICADASDGLELIRCAHPRQEAQVAALRMRLELETPGRSVALIARDRALARRVAAALRRWSIQVDDSAGTALASTPPGALFRLAGEACAQNWAPVPLLAVLKHPLCQLRHPRGELRRLARRLERACLRGPRPAPGIAGVKAALAESERRRARNDGGAGSAGSGSDGNSNDDNATLRALLDRLEAASGALCRLLQRPRAPLGELVRAHIACLEALTATPDGEAACWQGEDGEALYGFVCELLDDAAALGRVQGSAWPALLESLLAGRAVRPRFGRHPRAFVWGPLEARLQQADVVILAGLVEGSWPPEAAADPWLGRPMRERFGLGPPEARIGQAAHDFVQLAAGEKVVLLYSRRAGGAPTAPARWLLRLEALLARHGQARQPLQAGAACAAWQARLERPQAITPAPAPRPRPPRQARPDKLSVTQVQIWQRDPYAIYARHILGLKPLDEIDRDADAAQRGSLIHQALADFTAEHPAALPADALERLIAAGRKVFAPAMDRPAVATFWWRRFQRIAAWLIDEERGRRPALATVAAEVEGALTLTAADGRAFQLIARADRLERGHDGSVAVIDYKTGTVPPKKDVASGRAPQLPLEAAMARYGAFADMAPAPVAALEHWRLSGGEPPGKVEAVAGPEQTISDALAGLRRLIAAFADPETPYLDHPAGAAVGPFDDYVDIARSDEWRQGPGRSLGDDADGAPDIAAPASPGALVGHDVQQACSDPARSVWVTASAGTGKTKVLTDRVLRLLLAGCAPGRILCLTFTRAAAAEMGSRIRRELADWAGYGEEQLACRLQALTGKAPTAAAMRLARQLFALVLDAPDGLRIATIHSFCQSLLGRFPLEAGIAPGFTAVEERESAELRRAARDRVLGEIAAGARPELDQALDRLVVAASERRADMLTGELDANGARIELMLAQHGGLQGALAALAAGLGIAGDTTPEALDAATCRDGAFAADALREAAQALEAGSATDRARAREITAFLDAPQDARAALLEGYVRCFLTAAGEVRKALCTKAVREARPGAAAALEREGERLALHAERRHGLAAFARTRALLVVGDAILAAFRALKRERAVLDYDDLIAHARRLLTQDGMASWVLYKLDGGIDHILVDEAQDTNPFQWQAILALADEFFAGAGASDRQRTLFVVGDEKQSIFSFQGADIDRLHEVRGELERRVPAPHWLEGELELSYRSVPAVLAFVDAVFALPEARDGVVSAGKKLRHQPQRRGDGGLVEVWPLLPKENKPDEADPWTACLDQEAPRTGSDRLADAIARRIAAMTGAGGARAEMLEAERRPLRPGDVLVLLRRRAGLLPALMRALRRHGVAVAGADRMDLARETAVRDLLALARFCLLPADDLALASVLKGPLIGFDDDQLFALAWPRPERPASLWRRLQGRRDRDQACARAADWLQACLRRTDWAPPFAFFEAVLTGPAATPQAEGDDRPASGRKALAARLGLEALEALDEFLDLTLSYERDHPPSLQGFVHWFASGSAEAKREAATGGDAVRIMTVHGAKGLQAPVVFVADDMARKPNLPAILWDRKAQLPLWTGGDAWSARLKGEETARREQEERRLLYVALTRARDRLYVVAAQGAAPYPNSWHDLARRGIAACKGGAEFDFEEFDFTATEEGRAACEGMEPPDDPEGGWPGALRLTCRQSATAPPAPARHAPPPIPPLPAAAWRPLPPEAPPRPQRPSGPPSPLAAGGGEGRRRGQLVHRLLELLPDLPAGERQGSGEALAARHAPAMAATERRALVADVLAIVADRAFAPLFAPGSRAEVALAGRCGGRIVAGRVDRLAVTPEAVAVVEYKTGHAAPARVEATPAPHLAQLAAYRELLAQIYPERRIACHLLWTDRPQLVEIPAPLLDAHRPGG